jgi:hypothetical protein
MSLMKIMGVACLLFGVVLAFRLVRGVPPRE